MPSMAAAGPMEEAERLEDQAVRIDEDDEDDADELPEAAVATSHVQQGVTASTYTIDRLATVDRSVCVHRGGPLPGACTAARAVTTSPTRSPWRPLRSPLTFTTSLVHPCPQRRTSRRGAQTHQRTPCCQATPSTCLWVRRLPWPVSTARASRCPCWHLRPADNNFVCTTSVGYVSPGERFTKYAPLLPSLGVPRTGG